MNTLVTLHVMLTYSEILIKQNSLSSSYEDT